MKPSSDRVRDQVAGVILAGGKATRMGSVDKGLVAVNDRPMIAHVIDALRPQVAELLINANRNHDRYREFGCKVIADADREFRGPLAGIASGMHAVRTPLVAFAPCDAPLLCEDLVPRLHAALSETDSCIAVAHDGERLQPVFVLLHRSLRDDLIAYLDDGGRKIDHWYERHGYATADFSDVAGAFSNINRPADRERIETELWQEIRKRSGGEPMR